LVDILNSGESYNLTEKEMLLRQVDAELTKLGEKTSGWVYREVERAYKQGAKDAKTLLSLAGSPVQGNFQKIDEWAIKAIADETFMDFGFALSNTKKSAAQILDTATKTRIQTLFAEGRITGETRKQISDAIAGELRSGFVALKDKSGKAWSLEAYSEMLARTKIVATTNEGLANRLIMNDFDLVRTTQHGGSCPLCSPREDRILSLTGKTRGCPTLDDARAGGFQHPNCRHRIVPYHPDFAEESKSWSVNLQRYV
jgi:hypothetical protein